jgi:hypothetical protein
MPVLPKPVPKRLFPQPVQPCRKASIINPASAAGVLDFQLPHKLFSPDLQIRATRALAPEASGLKSLSQTFLYVGAEAPTS